MGLQIYTASGGNFHNIELKKYSFSGKTMAFDNKIEGTFRYKDMSLLNEFKRNEYVIFRGEKYYLRYMPTINKYGLLSDNSELQGDTQYSCVFYSQNIFLQNIAFEDYPINDSEKDYKHGSRKFYFFGTYQELINRISINLQKLGNIDAKYEFLNSDLISNSTIISNMASEGFNIQLVNDEEATKETLDEPIQFDNNTIADALKALYDNFGLSYVIKQQHILVGYPLEEINHTFKYGQGNGLVTQNIESTQNDIITRLSAYGSTKNLPFRYPIIKTYNEPHTVIEHSYYSKDGRLMLPQVVEAIRKKVQYDAPDYDPNTPIYDFIDADDTYPNPINPAMPLLAQIDYDDIYPTIKGMTYNDVRIDKILGSYKYQQRVLVEEPLTSENINDTIDTDTGELQESYFKIKLSPLGFDLYAQASESGEGAINMITGSCRGCVFNIAVDWEDMNKNFWEKGEDGVLVYNPNKEDRNTDKYPDSTNQSIYVNVYKDNNTFGDASILPNKWMIPQNGDEFVFTGIIMPDTYIDSAQNKLEEEAKKDLRDNNVEKLKRPFVVDNHFLTTHQDIREALWFDKLIKFNVNNEDFVKPIESIEQSYGEDGLIKTTITITDEVEVVISQIGKIMRELDETQKVISGLQDDIHRTTVSASRGYKKVAQGLFDSSGNNKIDNLYIETQALFTGEDVNDFSLQDVIITAIPTGVSCQSGSIYHNKVSRGTEYNSTLAVWDIIPTTIALEEDKDYYLYIKASKIDNSATWVASEDKITYDQTDYFYFKYGQLIIVDEERKVYNTYGMSALLGGHLTTLSIQSPFFSDTNKTGIKLDLVNNILQAYQGVDIVGNVKITGGETKDLLDALGVKADSAIAQSLEAIEDAEEAQTNATQAKASATAANNAVTSLNTYVDGAFNDGVIEEAEAVAIEKYFNNIYTTQKQVNDDYNKIHNSEYLSSSLNAALENAYDGFTTAINNLISSISTAITDGKATAAEKQNVDDKFTLYNTAYSTFISALNNANEYIINQIRITANQALDQYGGLEFLTEALNEDTQVLGGLILTSVIELGKKVSGVFNVYSGINGLMTDGAKGNGIAAWFGGGMIDKEVDTTNSNAAKSLIRFDGSGYLANGNISWDEEGNSVYKGSIKTANTNENDKRSLTIEDNTILISDKNGAPSLKVDGEIIDSIDDLITTSSQTISFTTTRSDSISLTAGGVTTNSSWYDYLLATISLDSSKSYKIVIPSFSANATITNTSAAAVSDEHYASGSVSFTYYKQYGNGKLEIIKSFGLQVDSNSSTNDSITIPSQEVQWTGQDFTLRLGYRMEIGASDDTYSWRLDLNILNTTSNITITEICNIARIFGNGMVVSQSSDKYFAVFRDDTNQLIQAKDDIYQLDMCQTYYTSTSWYKKWNNGFLEMGGKITGNGSRTITFPISFLNNPISVSVNAICTKLTSDGSNYIKSVSSSTMMVQLDGASECTGAYWTAQGVWK